MILSMDFGTTSLKTALLNDDLSIVKSSKVEYRYTVRNGDWVELDAALLISAIREGVRALGGEAGQIELICFDTFSPSMVFMDETGAALHPVVTHLDRRSKEQSERILREMGAKKFQSIAGLFPFTGGASITTAMWFMQNEPGIFKNTYKLGHLNTFIYKYLTGIWSGDPVNASQSGMYETVSGNGWSKEICGAFGIPTDKLPEIRQAGVKGGFLTKNAAEATGLKEGVPVALGTNDAAAAQIGAGNEHAGDVLIITGSSEMISILTDKPIVDDKYYLRNAATPGLWQIYATTAGGIAIDWAWGALYKDLGEKAFYKGELHRCILEAADTPVKFEPYLAGDRQSLAPKTASFTGITLAAGREDFLKAILVGMQQPIKDTIELAGKFLKLNPIVDITGGMAREDYIGLKKKLMPGYEFKVIDDCPIIGNARLALKNM